MRFWTRFSAVDSATELSDRRPTMIRSVTPDHQSASPKRTTRELRRGGGCSLRCSCSALPGVALGASVYEWAKRVAISSHAADSDRDKDKHYGQREQQQYERGRNDDNLARALPPSKSAERHACKRGEKYPSDNEREKRNTKQPQRIVVRGDHDVALVA